jgi:MerR family transcriptional regulator/heat shock protein HspR
MELQNHVLALQARLTELNAELEEARAEVVRREQQVHASYRRDLVPMNPSHVVVWKPPGRHSPDR